MYRCMGFELLHVCNLYIINTYKFWFHMSSHDNETLAEVGSNMKIVREVLHADQESQLHAGSTCRSHGIEMLSLVKHHVYQLHAARYYNHTNKNRSYYLSPFYTVTDRALLLGSLSIQFHDSDLSFYRTIYMAVLFLNDCLIENS